MSDRHAIAGCLMTLAEEAGLSRSEVQIIQSLVNYEDGQIVELLAEETKVPKTKIYHVLKKMEKKGIVQAIHKWPKKYVMRDLETVSRNILQEGLNRINTEFRNLERSKEQLNSLAGETLASFRGEVPTGISTQVFRKTALVDDNVRAIYRVFIENESKARQEYRGISPTTILQVPDNWVQHELRKRWKELHKERIKGGIKARYVCYLGDMEKRVQQNSESPLRIYLSLTELEKNLMELKNLDLAFSDRRPWGAVLIWDDWAALLLSQRSDPFQEPYQEGISIEGRAAVTILKEQFDTYFKSIVDSNLAQILQRDKPSGKIRTHQNILEAIGKLSEEERSECLKRHSLGKVRSLLKLIRPKVTEDQLRALSSIR
jgi:predicted transcriptional regulator